jgi:cytochrome c-type biogenesis protein CcmE
MNNSRLLKVMLSVAVVLGGAGFVVYSSLGHAEYYKMVDEVMVEPSEWVDKSLRVHGFVEAGSIDEEIVDQKMHRSFVLENQGQRIVVRHVGPVPDTFKDLSEVVAKGRLVQADGGYVLEASELSAKCPSKYEGAPRNKDLGSDQTAYEPVF